MFSRALCELVRASKASAAARKASARQFFCCPQATRAVRLSGKRAWANAWSNGSASLHGSGGRATLPRQHRALQADRRQAQGLGQRHFRFQQKGHEVRELGMAVIADNGTQDRNPRRRAAQPGPQRQKHGSQRNHHRRDRQSQHRPGDHAREAEIEIQ